MFSSYLTVPPLTGSQRRSPTVPIPKNRRGDMLAVLVLLLSLNATEYFVPDVWQNRQNSFTDYSSNKVATLRVGGLFELPESKLCMICLHLPSELQ